MTYETTERIDATELPQDKKTDLAERMLSDDGGITHIEELKQDAYRGEFDPTPRTITTEYHGDSVEAALARGYKIRDTIEKQTDASVECEPTGVEYEFPSTIFYQLDLHINGGDD